MSATHDPVPLDDRRTRPFARSAEVTDERHATAPNTTRVTRG